MARTAARRPLKSRGSTAVQRFAAALAARRVAPNAISAASIVFSLLAAAGLALAAAGDAAAVQAAGLVVAAAAIQARLLCNLLDGLVAVEGGLRTADGELFNEVPDRISDTVVLVAAGYAVTAYGFGPELGWAAALAAALTAYVRALGGSLGLPQDFGGPFAKPQRMALLTLACLASIAEAAIDDMQGRVLAGALLLIAAGSVVTCARRLAGIRAGLRAREA